MANRKRINFDRVAHLRPRFSFLLDERGFQLREAKYEPQSFGDFFIELVSDDFLFRLVKDRGEKYSLIAPISDPRDWYDVGLIRALILKSTSLDAVTLDTEAEFIRLNYDTIKDIFSGSEFPATSRRLRRLGAERMANSKRFF